MFPVRVNEPLLQAAFDWSFVSCGDSAEINFTNLSENNQANTVGWSWTFSNGDTSSQETPPSVLIRNRQNLIVDLILQSGDGCADTVRQVIPVNIINVQLRDTLIACPSEGVELNPDGNSSWIYEWSPAAGLDNPNSFNPRATPDQTTTYTTIITDASALDTCQVSRQIVVVVPPPLTLEVSDDIVTCDRTVRLGANATGEIIRWSRQSDFMNIFSTDDTVTVNAVGERYYYVETEDEFGCILSDSVLVTGNAPSIFSTDETICFGDTVQLQSFNQNPAQTLTYSWTPTGSILAGATSPAPVVAPGQTTVYIATITNNLGCTFIDSITVSVLPDFPNLLITALPDTIIPGDTAQLTVILNTTYEYEWSPTDNMDDPTVFNPKVWPLESTTYSVTVTDVNGCTEEASVRVFVRDPECIDPFIFVPNAFSPNGDGENDFFEVYGWPVEELHMVVYNRWGQKVFETREVNGRWDGRFKGQELPPDVFGYYVEVRCIGGATYFKRGNVTLLK